jgi:replicative superfamily II helicase
MTEERIPTSVVPHLHYPFEWFNPAQSLVVPHRDTDANLVCAFRTGAGKTVCAELIMDAVLRRGKKALYTSPLKALSQEKYDDWTSSKHAFSQYKVSILTGDYRLTEARVKELQSSNIIILTSEMMDSRVKKYQTEKNDWLLDIGVAVIDEANLLGTEGRGDALECGLMKFSELNPNSMLVFLSATVANSEELSAWSKSLNGKPSLHLRSDYRPCPLKKHYVEYPDKGRYADKEKSKLKVAMQVLEENDKDHFLFFVHSKATGDSLLKEMKMMGYKVAFHNADLEKEDRQRIEKEFREGTLEHLIATSTIAYGMNLPARRVLVFGVHRGMNIVDPSDIIQEFGRAGRPGYDTEGDAYLLVPESKAIRFKEMVEKEPTVKSQLLDVEVLAFHLISDIEKKEIKTLEDVQRWYERSFAKFQGEKLKPNLVEEVIRRLEQINAIKVVDGAYECQAIGKIAAWFYQSPFDVAQWKGNFERIFRRTKNPDEMDMAWAISHVDSYLQKTWLHKDDELKAVDLQREYWRRGYSYDKKATSIVYGLISHLKSKGIPTRGRGAIFQIVIDAERIVDTIKTVGTYTKAYDPDGKFWEVFSLRLQTGASKEMVPLVQLDGVGPKRAGMLLKENIKSPGDVMSSATKVKEVLGEKIGASVIEAANKLIRSPHAKLY